MDLFYLVLLYINFTSVFSYDYMQCEEVCCEGGFCESECSVINVTVSNTKKKEICDVNCNLTMVNPKVIINPYKEDRDNLVPQKPLGSVFLKCAACLAIADEVNKTIFKHIEQQKKLISITDVIKSINNSNAIENLCSEGFKSFDLRKFHNEILVIKVNKCTQHVQTAMDGLWTKKLRQLCKMFISLTDVAEIVKNVFTEDFKTVDYFCRRSGVFRFCNNLGEAHILSASEIGFRCE